VNAVTLTPEERRLVQREWTRRVEAEYRSAAITHHLTLWLLKLVAPFELIRAGLSIVDDELVHSELSHAVLVAAGGGGVPPMEPATIGLRHPPDDELLRAVVQTSVETFCLGETVAVRLFSRLRAPATEPAARAALDRILKDEVRHRDFGWSLLEWLLSTPQSGVVRGLVQEMLPDMFARLRTNYAYSELHREGSPSPALGAFGLMPTPDYAAALEETLTRDYIPRFGAHDIDARAAWEARK
jgi:hypothetical protein